MPEFWACILNFGCMAPAKFFKFTLLVVVINLTLSFLITYLSYYHLDKTLSRNSIVWNSTTEEFIVSVILAPALETLLFQYYSYKLFTYITRDVSLKDKNKEWLFIVCSSLIFSAMHGYNWLYQVSAFLGGVTLNYSYLYFKKAKFYPYLSVVLIHLLYNLCVFFIKKHLS